MGVDLFGDLDLPTAGGADEVQDITDQPLPPLYDDESTSDVGALSSVPGADIGPATEANPDVPAGDLGDDPNIGRRNRRSAAERISQLTRRYREEQENRGLAEQLLENQSRQISALQQQVASIGQPAYRGAPANPGVLPRPTAGDLFDDTQDPASAAPTLQPGVGVPASLTRDDVRSVLREVVMENQAEQQRAVAEQQRLLTAHQEAFSIASEDFPELTDQRSTARKMFDELYDNSPIKHLPDAPLQIAYQVRGILADQRSPRQADQAKRQMAGVVPTPTGAAELGETQFAAAKKRVGELREAIRNGDSSFNTYKQLRVLSSQLQRARRR